jgi:hypothetical protein
MTSIEQTRVLNELRSLKEQIGHNRELMCRNLTLLSKATTALEACRKAVEARAGGPPPPAGCLDYQGLRETGLSPKESVRILYCFGSEDANGAFTVEGDQLESYLDQLAEVDLGHQPAKMLHNARVPPRQSIPHWTGQRAL